MKKHHAECREAQIVRLPLNYENVEREINEQLEKLKMASDAETAKTTAAEIAKCVSRIHLHDLSQSKLPVYDVRWVIGLVRECKSCECKDDIMSALEYMSKLECYNPMDTNEIKYDRFMTWNMDEANWQSEYSSGHIGRYVWDIAAIINHVNNPSFSDTFLDSYMQYSGRKFTLAGLYANLYYVQAVEAVRTNDYESIKQTTKELTEQKGFKTELILDETIVRLKMIGF